MRGSGSESLSIHKDDMDKLKDKLEQAIKSAPALQKIKEHVVFTVTGEGLRVELLEGEYGTFFESGSAIPTEFGKDLLQSWPGDWKAAEPGHDGRAHGFPPFVGQAGYTNWELSADRANASRRWMQQHGLRIDQVTQVRDLPIRACAIPRILRMRPTAGYADHPVPGADPSPAPAAVPSGQKTAAAPVRFHPVRKLALCRRRAPAVKPSPAPVPPAKRA